MAGRWWETYLESPICSTVSHMPHDVLMALEGWGICAHEHMPL